MIAFIIISFLSLVSTVCGNSNAHITSLGSFTKVEDKFTKYSKYKKINFTFMEKIFNKTNEYKIVFKLLINEKVSVFLVKKSKEDTEYKKCKYIGDNFVSKNFITKTVLLENIQDGDKFKILIRYTNNNVSIYSDVYFVYNENTESISESDNLETILSDNLENENLETVEEKETFYDIANEALETMQKKVDDVLNLYSDDETYDSKKEEISLTKKKDD
ncbi:hypothetical protein EHP00_1546 [Ecytonucleospora hepatopenaei]|uniref:Uncharacterized protein n=1 Tax=Ecytonucleospora hepatopenaei TaxID=646526 RepID=A0A1W0E7G6_9MICR|nr:hypothetical protein EHP00_1546 [Ecytonucleospora hepatopenaei]